MLRLRFRLVEEFGASLLIYGSCLRSLWYCLLRVSIPPSDAVLALPVRRRQWQLLVFFAARQAQSQFETGESIRDRHKIWRARKQSVLESQTTVRYRWLVVFHA